MQMEFVAHGVPQGHQSWGTTSDKYYESFYGQYDIYGKAKTVFVVEVWNSSDMQRSYYTLMHPKNVYAAGSRPGSYFGMSLRVDGSYCTDVYSLFHLFEIAFRQYITSRVLRQNGDTEQFLVEDLNSAAISLEEAKQYILNQIQTHLSHEFEKIDETFTKKKVHINEYYNPDDVDCEAFLNSTRLDGKVLISSEYPSKDSIIHSFQLKEKQSQEKIIADDKAIEVLTKENSSLKQAKELVASLKSEINKLKEEKQQLLSSLEKEKSTASSLKSQVEKLKVSTDISRIAEDLQTEMQKMMPLLNSIAPKKGGSPMTTPINRALQQNHSSDKGKKHNKTNPSNLLGYIVIAIIASLAIALAIFLGGPKAQKIKKLEKENTELKQNNANLQSEKDKLSKEYLVLKRQFNPEYDDTHSTSEDTAREEPIDPDEVKIDLKEYSGRGNLSKGIQYTARILYKKKNWSGPQGKWELDGFKIDSQSSVNQSTILIIPNKSGIVTLKYLVNDECIKERSFEAD